MRTRTFQAVRIGHAQVGCFPLTIERMENGVLLLAMRSPDPQAEEVRNELERIGSWLRSAIEAHLTSGSASQEDLERVSSFWRILRDSIWRGSDAGIVAAFAEILAVWHDLEVYGYIETSRGAFVRAVTLPGADLSESPATIAREALPGGGHLSKLPVAELERLGFATTRDLVVKRLGEGAGSWLIVLSGAPVSHELAALTLYLELLKDVMESALSVGASSAVASVSMKRFSDVRQPQAQASGGLDRLQPSSGFREIVEGTARHVLEHGDSVAPLVLASPPDVPGCLGAVQERIDRIRRHTRAADLVGMLGEQEAGICLRCADDEQARAVAGRLPIEAGESASPAVIRASMASRTPAAPGVETLIQDARNQPIGRDDAIQRAPENV